MMQGSEQQSAHTISSSVPPPNSNHSSPGKYAHTLTWARMCTCTHTQMHTHHTHTHTHTEPTWTSDTHTHTHTHTHAHAPHTHTEPTWTSDNLTSVDVNLFTSETGPTVEIPDTPTEVF